MPSIELHYGPYESNGIIRHRTQRLHGIIKYLTQKDYEIELVQTDILNRLSVIMRCATIFQCNIKNLLFNLEYEDDVVCQRAVAAIEEAAERLYSDTNVPRFASLGEGMRYINKLHDGKVGSYFSKSVGVLYEICKKQDEEDPDLHLYPSRRYKSRSRFRTEASAHHVPERELYSDVSMIGEDSDLGHRGSFDSESKLSIDWSLYKTTTTEGKPLSEPQQPREELVDIVHLNSPAGPLSTTKMGNEENVEEAQGEETLDLEAEIKEEAEAIVEEEEPSVPENITEEATPHESQEDQGITPSGKEEGNEKTEALEEEKHDMVTTADTIEEGLPEDDTTVTMVDETCMENFYGELLEEGEEADYWYREDVPEGGLRTIEITEGNIGTTEFVEGMPPSTDIADVQGTIAITQLEELLEGEDFQEAFEEGGEFFAFHEGAGFEVYGEGFGEMGEETMHWMPEGEGLSEMHEELVPPLDDLGELGIQE